MMRLGLPEPCLPRTSRLQDPDLPGYPDGIQGKPEAVSRTTPSPTSLAQGLRAPAPEEGLWAKHQG